MVRKIKNLTALFLALTILIAGEPVLPSRAQDSDTQTISYWIPGVGTFKTACLDDALQASFQYEGVNIVMRGKQQEILLQDGLSYGYLNDKTRLTINAGTKVTISKYNFRMDGVLNIMGELNLQDSAGIMYGNGRINLLDSGEYVKKEYEIKKSGDYCLEGKTIQYGQKLGDSEIAKDKVNWIPSIEGTWEFTEPDFVPQAGTSGHDVVFRPKYPMSYEEKKFEKGGKVTTKQTVPKRISYVTPTLHVGQSLLGLQPEMIYLSPVTGERVDGKFSFEQDDIVLSEAGAQEYRGTFTPENANFAAITQYATVNVLSTKPDVAEMPTIRNQGTYGQKLEDIRFLNGKCTNPYTGKQIRGSWEWSNPSERLSLGSKTYRMLFVPEEQGYEKVELDMTVNTLPKEMESIVWPTCSDIEYGQALSDSALSFTKNSYGTFAWKNENIRPNVKNQGAAVVFTPANTQIYDWSKMAGYDEITNSVTYTIPIEVHSISGELPTLEAASIKEDQYLAQSLITLKGMKGSVEWQNPKQEVEQSGWYPVWYLPSDVSNYDWSSFCPREDGRIAMEVYLDVEPKPTAAPTVTPRPTPAPTMEITPEPAGEVTSEPTEEITPEPTWEVTSEPTEEITPEPAGEVTSAPTGEVTPEPAGEVTPEPAGEVTSAPTGEITPEPAGEVTSAPTGEVTPEPAGEVTSEPAGEVTPPAGEVTSEPAGEVTPPAGEVTPEPAGEITPEPAGEMTPVSTAEVTLAPTVEPTAAVTEGVQSGEKPVPTLKATPEVSVPTPEATREPAKDSNSTVVDNSSQTTATEEKREEHEIPEASVPNAGSSYVITQLVSKVSSISSSTTVGKSVIRYAKRTGKTAKISWKKISGAKYVLQYSTSKKMKKGRKKQTAKVTATLSGLSRRKTYYVRVRAWKMKKGRRVYGKWSKVKKMSA